MSLKRAFSAVAAVGALCFAAVAAPAYAVGTQPYFSCKTVSGKLVSFSRAGKVLKYSYGKPGLAPELTFAVPLGAVEFAGSGPAGAGTWWVNREVSVVFNGTRYTGHWAYHRADGTEEAGVTVSRGERTLAETACKSDIQIDIPEIEE